MGLTTPLCSCNIQLIPQQAIPGISPFCILQTQTISASPCSFLTAKTKVLRLRQRHDKLRQTYMLAALNTKEACSQQTKDKYDDIPQYKIGDLIMIKNLDTN